MNMNQRLRIVMQLTLAVTIVGLTACGDGAKEPVIQPIETVVPTSSASASGPSRPIANFLAPLTGLPVENEVINRPFAVMINNLAPARPQSGLTQADIVWELLAEGGIT